MVSLAVHYLIDAEAIKDGLRLVLYNSSERAWEELLDKHYRPYFFVPYPPSRENMDIIKGLDAETRMEEKMDLFTGQMVRVTRVEIEDFSDLRWASERFEKAWEGDVPSILGYVYDHGLVFGAQHILQDGKVKPVFEVSEETKLRFEEKFSSVKKADPAKYELLERLFLLPTNS